jgi:glycosyltransferase A (GT-A) superfamily protein (DUF2064 family)
MNAAQLLVLAKVPAPGRTKTRLCPPCTPQQAADVAAAALADTLDAVRATAAARRVLALDRLPALAAPGCATIRQRGKGLGERIVVAFSDAAPGEPRPTLQIGMDTPQVTGELLDDCLAALGRPGVDAVLGPAEDGGWWALGLRDPARAGLLVDVPMSTSDTGRLTLAALRSAGLRVAGLPVLRDVDTWPDAVVVAAQAPHTRFAACIRALPHAA